MTRLPANPKPARPLRCDPEFLDPVAAWRALPERAKEEIGAAAIAVGIASTGVYVGNRRPESGAGRPYTTALIEAGEWLECVVMIAVLGWQVRDRLPPIPDLRPMGIQQCSGCGCTQEHGCEGGCSWTTPDRCSLCAAPPPRPQRRKRDTMSWAGALTRANINEYLGETYELDARQHGAYALLTMRYLLAGPLPSDEKRLADIARVTKHMWRNRIWPVLQEFFVPCDDGLIHHEELDRLFRAPVAGSETRRAASARNAARARWQKASEAQQLVMPEDAIGTSQASVSVPVMTDAQLVSASAAHMRSHSSAYPEVSDFNARGKNSYENRDAERMSDALPPLRASSLSKAGTSGTDSPQNQRESLRERGRARAGAGAIDDAPGHAEADAQVDAQPLSASAAHPAPHRRRASPPAVVTTPMTADWQPSPEAELEARRRGYDPEEMTARFRDWYIAKGELRADWNAQYKIWCRREDGRGSRQQGHMPLAVQGGAAGKPVRTEADKALDARLAALGLTREVFDAACLANKPADAHRWVTAREGWLASGAPKDIPFPSFHDYVSRPNRYADDLAAAETVSGDRRASDG